MDNDILFFFGERMDALPIYVRLEEAILARIPDVKNEELLGWIQEAAEFASVKGRGK